MEREDHINKLHQKLNSNTVIKDKDALWTELESRLPKKKKKSGILIFLFSLLMILSVIGLGSIYIHQSNSDNYNVSQIEYTRSLENITSSKIPLNQENTLAEDDDHLKTPKGKKTPVSNKEIANGASSRNIKSDISLQPNHINRNDKQTSSTVSNLNSEIDIPIAALENKLNHESNVNPLLNNNESNKKIIKPLVLEDNNESQVEYNQGTKLKNSSVLDQTNKEIKQKQIGQITPHLEENINLYFPSLDRLFTQISYPFQTIDRHPQIDDLNSRLKNNKKLQIIINSYAIADYNFKSQTNLSNYGNRIEELTSILPGYSLGAILSAQHHSGLIFGLGIEHSTFFEKFKIDNTVSMTETFINDEAFSFQGEFISNEQVVNKTITQEALNYNEYSNLTIMPSLGYAFTNRLTYGLSLSPIINLQQNYTGYLVDEQNIITNDLKDLYSSNDLTIKGFSISGSISKKIGNLFHIGIRTQLRQFHHNVSQSNAHYKINLRTISLGLEATYHIN